MAPAAFFFCPSWQIEYLVSQGCVQILSDLLGESSMVMMALEGIERVLSVGDLRVVRSAIASHSHADQVRTFTPCFRVLCLLGLLEIRRWKYLRQTAYIYLARRSRQDCHRLTLARRPGSSPPTDVFVMYLYIRTILIVCAYTNDPSISRQCGTRFGTSEASNVEANDLCVTIITLTIRNNPALLGQGVICSSSGTAIQGVVQHSRGVHTSTRFADRPPY